MAKIVTASEVNVQVTGTESVKAINDELAKSKELLEEVGKEHGKNSEHYKNAEQGVKFLEDALAETNKELKELGDKNIKQVQNETKKLKKGFDAIGNTGALFEELGGNVGHLGSAMGKASDTANLFSSKLTAFGKLKTQVLGAASAFKGNLVAALGKARVAALAFVSALGIGILIAGIAVLVSNWKKISVFLGLSASEAEKFADAAERAAEAADKQFNRVKGMTNQLKLQGFTEREILNIKIKAAQADILAAKNRHEALQAQREAQIEIAQRNKKIVAGILNFIAVPIQLIARTVDGVAKVFGKDLNLTGKAIDTISSLAFDPNKVDKEGAAALEASKKNYNALQEELAGFQLAVQNLDKKAKETKKQKRVEERQEEKEIQAEYDAEDIARHEAEIALERKRQEEEAARDDAHQKKLNQQRKEAAEEELKEYEKKWAAREAIQNAAYGTAQHFSKLLGELGQNNLKVQKAQALIQVGIDTASAISSLVKMSQANPANAVTAGAAGALQFASGLLQITANIAKAVNILNAPTPNIGGAGAGGGGGAFTEPNIQPQQKDVKVFVTETDITTAQQRVNNLNKIGIID